MTKSTKAEAHYQGRPKGSACCKLCTMFRPPSGCTAVKGAVSPNGWCEYFKRAANLKGSLAS